ncbi:hypothetical protein AZI85_03585 [Bdellovibrio bacteriovorus]|uniref:Adhesin n=1 Tax=Bdellovibrio bacteriovorus TaxID=959 RepID=A0A150WKH8_BDEBC|nr:hypothetical protein [Bdellovibrio bacteriovorus]KYG64509.1 hypothetical protein AZI85_03585 [Bdellovibrio bacteriovorus]
MTFKSLSLFLLTVSFAGAASATNEVVVSCRDYNISLTDFGDIAVEPAQKAESPTVIAIHHENQLLKNDGDGLHIVGSKKRMGMITAKQSLEVNYKTGRGIFTDYTVMQGPANGKKILLESCRR